MNVFVIYAHPNPLSLNSHLKNHMVQALESEGHQVKLSDLYAMRWKAIADSEDFPDRDASIPLDYMTASGEAYESGTQSPDIQVEQDKLMWADAVIFQFPAWWFGFPAILKGWVDRVFAFKFAYGYKNAGNTHRYGDGALAGKRAMLSITLGGPEVDYGPRGINGTLDELLFPITHGTLFFPGLAVLPTFAVYNTGKIDAPSVEEAKLQLSRRMASLFTETPIAFRAQNDGSYPDRHVLASEIAPGDSGISVHIAMDLAASEA